MFRPSFVAIFREVYFRSIYYKNNRTNVKIWIKLFVINLRGYEVFMCCVCYIAMLCLQMDTKWRPKGVAD